MIDINYYIYVKIYKFKAYLVAENRNNKEKLKKNYFQKIIYYFFSY